MTGLRRGEICALQWSDLDMVEKKLYVNRSASYQGEVGKTKTLYSERVIKLFINFQKLLSNITSERI